MPLNIAKWMRTRGTEGCPVSSKIIISSFRNYDPLGPAITQSVRPYARLRKPSKIASFAKDVQKCAFFDAPKMQLPNRSRFEDKCFAEVEHFHFPPFSASSRDVTILCKYRLTKPPARLSLVAQTTHSRRAKRGGSHQFFRKKSK